MKEYNKEVHSRNINCKHVDSNVNDSSNETAGSAPAGTSSSNSAIGSTSSELDIGKIDSANDRFPCCIVWTPIPMLTWILPFIGHIGICNSEGLIHDFSGPYTITVDDFLFGRPTRYLQLDPKKVGNVNSRISPTGINVPYHHYNENIVHDNSCHINTDNYDCENYNNDHDDNDDNGHDDMDNNHLDDNNAHIDTGHNVVKDEDVDSNEEDETKGRNHVFGDNASNREDHLDSTITIDPLQKRKKSYRSTKNRKSEKNAHLEAWDRAIQEGKSCYQRKMYNFICNNCHNYVAHCLNNMKYDGRTNWGVVEVCLLTFLGAKSVSVGRWLWTFLPFILILGFVLVMSIVSIQLARH